MCNRPAAFKHSVVFHSSVRWNWNGNWQWYKLHI